MSPDLSHEFQALPLPGPYPLSLIVRRTLLGSLALIGGFLILATEIHSVLTGAPHALLPLTFGVSLLLGSVVVAAILSLLAHERPSLRPFTDRNAAR